MLAHARAVLTSANRSHLLTESDQGFCSWLLPPPCPHTLFSTGSVGSKALLSVGQGKLYVCVSRLLFQVLPVVMQIHGVNKHQRKWVRTVCPRLLLQMVWEVDGAAVLQVTGGVCSFFGYRCTSTLIDVGRKAQGLLLSCPHSYFHAVCREIEGMTAGSGLAGHSWTPSSLLSCSGWHQ